MIYRICKSIDRFLVRRKIVMKDRENFPMFFFFLFFQFLKGKLIVPCAVRNRSSAQWKIVMIQRANEFLLRTM